MPLMPLDFGRKSEYLEAQGECLEMQGGGGNQTPNPGVVGQKYYPLPTSQYHLLYLNILHSYNVGELTKTV